MEHTKDLFKALCDNDYTKAQDSLKSALGKIVNDRIEAKKSEIRDKLSTSDS
jgi:hypothetical protein|tara:strand:- start:2236 stop:2391 length:156 start_codon:yes stop_codon:yes gene_type:complete